MINTFALLIPVFLLIVLIEWYISYKRQDKRYTTASLSMNMTIGAIDQFASLIYFALMYLVLEFVYTHFRIFTMKTNWQQWVLAYIATDFLGYWYHRISHRVNILWAGHITHHSSELFNFSNGFRTSLFQGINRILFWAILPIFGFSPVILVIIFKVSGLYDFIVHTEYVPKLQVIEKVFITPSLHRVHHGKNDIYIDKNYGSTFSIWDRLFGTFQEETEKVNYGIKGAYTDNHPLWAIGHYYYFLWTSIRATSEWKNKIKLLFMPPEWKPDTLNTEHQKILLKNKIKVPQYLKNYAIFQIISCVIGIILLLTFKNFMSTPEFIVCAYFGISTMSTVALIFNENIEEGYTNRELLRLALGILVVIITFYIYTKIYLLYILFFLFISIALISQKRFSHS